MEIDGSESSNWIGKLENVKTQSILLTRQWSQLQLDYIKVTLRNDVDVCLTLDFWHCI